MENQTHFVQITFEELTQFELLQEKAQHLADDARRLKAYLVFMFVLCGLLLLACHAFNREISAGAHELQIANQRLAADLVQFERSNASLESCDRRNQVLAGIAAGRLLTGAQ